MSAEGTALGTADVQAQAGANADANVGAANTDASATAAATAGKPDGSGSAVTLTADQQAAADLIASAKTPEEKAAAEKLKAEADEKAKAEADKKKPAERIAPEKYEDFKLPDGFELDKDALDIALPVMKELKMPQAEAQKLVDAYAKISAKMVERQHAAWDKVVSGWLETAKTDKDIGGEKFEENVGLAKTAIGKLGTPAFVEALNTTGAGNHPEFIRVFAKIGRYIADDKLHLGGGPGSKTSREDRIYNNTP